MRSNAKGSIFFEHMPKYLDAELFRKFISQKAVDESIRAVEARRSHQPEKVRLDLNEYIARLDQIGAVGQAAGEVHRGGGLRSGCNN